MEGADEPTDQFRTRETLGGPSKSNTPSLASPVREGIDLRNRRKMGNKRGEHFPPHLTASLFPSRVEISIGLSFLVPYPFQSHPPPQPPARYDPQRETRRTKKLGARNAKKEPLLMMEKSHASAWERNLNFVCTDLRLPVSSNLFFGDRFRNQRNLIRWRSAHS